MCTPYPTISYITEEDLTCKYNDFLYNQFHRTAAKGWKLPCCKSSLPAFFFYKDEDVDFEVS